MKKIFGLLSLIILLSCCSTKQGKVVSDKESVTVGTFNLEWLGDGIRDRIDRTEEDYKLIANVIKETGCDIFGLEEIENDDALMRVVKYLPDFSFFVSKGGSKQNVAVIYKKDIKVDYLGDYEPIAIEHGRNRPGMVLKAKKGNFDWLMLVVHLKSSSHYEETEEDKEKSRDVRELQAQRIALWADSVQRSDNEKDIIIVGDFNDTPKRKKNNTMAALLNDNSLTFLTSDLKSCKFKSAYVIDQIIASKSAMKRFVENSQREYDIFSILTKEQTDKISDHCPVMVKFEVKSPDND